MNALGLSILNSLKTLEALELDTTGLLAGLSFSKEDLEAGRRWVPWSDAATLFDRLEPRLEPADLEALARAHLESHPAIRVLAQLAVSSSAWLDLFWRLSAPVNPMVALRYDAGPAEHRLELTLHEGLKPCALWFELSHHCAVVAPLSVGGRPLKVRSLHHDGRSLRACYEAPTEGVSAERRQRASELPLSAVFESLELFGRWAGPALRDGNLQLGERHRGAVDEVLSLASAWGLTLAEARVALSLGEGRTLAGVAEALDLAVATVRVHLKHVYAKTTCVGQRKLEARVRAWRLA